jgi:large subunit ribosomal protein L17
MEHRKNRLRLNQKPNHAQLLLRNLATSIVLYETVRTTKKRAKVVVPMVHKLITIAKTKEPREAIRAINAVVMHGNASKKLIEVLKPRYASRHSGYTRITPVGARKGDGAELVDLELMDRDADAEPMPAKEKKPKVAKPVSATSKDEAGRTSAPAA